MCLVLLTFCVRVSQFERARKRHEQQCFRNNVSSFATAFMSDGPFFRVGAGQFLGPDFFPPLCCACTFLVGKSLCKIFLNQTGDLDSEKHLLGFPPSWLLLHDLSVRIPICLACHAISSPVRLKWIS